jgi:hypothetical protein
LGRVHPGRARPLLPRSLARLSVSRARTGRCLDLALPHFMPRFDLPLPPRKIKIKKDPFHVIQKLTLTDVVSDRT